MTSPKSIRAKLAKQLKSLVFRRVESVLEQGDAIECRWYEGDVNAVVSDSVEINANPVGESYKVITPRVFTADELNRNVEYHFKSFKLATSANAVRSDRFNGQRIFASSLKFAELDPDTFELHKKPTTILPIPGDLICGYVTPPSKDERMPSYNKWFVCSEQFLRAWTLIVFDQHKSFPEGEDELRRQMFKGNRLCTANYHKWLRTHFMNFDVPSEGEVAKRFFHYRTEKASIDWCHIYAAVVLMARYDELPTKANIPQTMGKDDHKCKHWLIPEGYADKLIARFA